MSASTRVRQWITEALVQAAGTDALSADLNVLNDLSSFTIPDEAPAPVDLPTGQYHGNSVKGRLDTMDFTVVMGGHYPELTRVGTVYDFSFIEQKTASTIPSGDTTATGTVAYDLIGRLDNVSLGTVANTNDPRLDTYTYRVYYYKRQDSTQTAAECEYDFRITPQKAQIGGVDIF